MSFNKIFRKEVLGKITKEGKEIIISAATETASWSRPTFVAKTLEAPFTKAVEQYPGPLPKNTTEICAREGSHVSPEDSRDHFTGVCFDEEGKGTSLHFPVAPKTTVQANSSQPAATPQWVWDANAEKYRRWDGTQWVWQ